jgi:hypothetical protein
MWGIAASGLVVLLGVGGAWATTFFVNGATGDDRNTCRAAAVGVPPAGPCETINGAIGKASAGDTVAVAAGRYDEDVSVTKTLTLRGPQAGVDARTRSGSEAEVSGGPSFRVAANSVIIDGFLIKTDGNGITLDAGTSGVRVLNNIIAEARGGVVLVNNSADLPAIIQRNLFNGCSSGVVAKTGEGSSVSGVVIDSNRFANGQGFDVILESKDTGLLSFVTISRNQFLASGKGAIGLTNVDSSTVIGNAISGPQGYGIITSGTSDLSITCNSILNSGPEPDNTGIFIEAPANSAVAANFNNIAGNKLGFGVDPDAYTGTLDAENNWWGDPRGPFAVPARPSIDDPDGVVDFTPFLTSPATCAALRSVRRGDDITVGSDLGGTGQLAMNFTGGAGPAGDTWIAVYDETPIDGTVKNVFGGNVSLSADVLMHPYNNTKGAGLLALFNEGAGKKGLALIVYDAGNSDALILATVDQAGKMVALKSAALGSKIQENAWYHLSMAVSVASGKFSVTGSVFKHATATDPGSSYVKPALGTLAYGPVTLASQGLSSSGEVGIVASARSANVDTSVANFAIGPIGP